MKLLVSNVVKATLLRVRGTCVSCSVIPLLVALVSFLSVRCGASIIPPEQGHALISEQAVGLVPVLQSHSARAEARGRSRHEPIPFTNFLYDEAGAGATCCLIGTALDREACSDYDVRRVVGDLHTCSSLRQRTPTVAPKSATTALTKFYPENAGFAGATERTFLQPGQMIDRYGGSGYSRFFSPQGTAYWARSLPPGTAGQPLRTFEVVKPFEVRSGTVAPWFNQPGGGVQYMSPVKLETLLNRGIIREVGP